MTDYDSDESYYDAETDIYYSRKNIKKSSVKITELPEEMLEKICYYLSQKDITSLLSTDRTTSQLYQEWNLQSRRELSKKLYDFPHYQIKYQLSIIEPYKNQRKISFENITISNEYLTKDSPIIIKINYKNKQTFLVITRNYFMITEVDYDKIFNEKYSYLWKKQNRIMEKIVINIINTQNNNEISLFFDNKSEEKIYFHCLANPLNFICFMISNNQIKLATYYNFEQTGLSDHVSDQNPYYHQFQNGKMLIITPSSIKLVDVKTFLLYQTETINVRRIIKLNELIINQENVRDIIIKIDDRKSKYFLTLYTDQNRFTFEEKVDN